MFPNMANMNMSNDMMKQQSKMFESMSDEQLQDHINRCKAFNPMFANLTPDQLRMMGRQMGGMSDSQLDSARSMAHQQMGGMGMPTPQPQNWQNTAPTSTQAGLSGVPEDVKDDYKEARKIKDEAAKEYKSKNFEAASTKYFEVLSIVRAKDELKDCNSG